MTTLLRWWKTYGKAHVAAVGLIAEFVIREFPGSTAATVASAAVAVLTVAGVVVAPHKTKSGSVSAGQVTVQVHADTSHLMASIAASLHGAAEAVTAATPKVKSTVQ